jgi:hypothetical protein
MFIFIIHDLKDVTAVFCFNLIYYWSEWSYIPTRPYPRQARRCAGVWISHNISWPSSTFSQEVRYEHSNRRDQEQHERYSKRRVASVIQILVRKQNKTCLSKDTLEFDKAIPCPQQESSIVCNSICKDIVFRFASLELQLKAITTKIRSRCDLTVSGYSACFSHRFTR